MDVMKKRFATGRAPALPVVDYSAARERAIQWLGDRYLLAKPIKAKQSVGPRTTSTTFDSSSSS
jgi:hypothetical protein